MSRQASNWLHVAQGMGIRTYEYNDFFESSIRPGKPVPQRPATHALTV